MRYLILILLFGSSLVGLSQRQFVFGVLKDSVSNELLIGAHVLNISSDKLTVTNEEGAFRIPVQVGDTLVFSNVGYQTLGWVAKESWFNQEHVQFKLPTDTTYLDEVVVHDLPEYNRFKQLIVESRPEDTSFWYHGVPQPKMEEYTVLEKKEFSNPLFIVNHPLSFFYHKFSKREKEKRKMQTIRKQHGMVSTANQKFTREWVGEMTELKGDQLTDFISFCNFTPEYIAKTPLYMIHEKMMGLLDDFMQRKSDG